MTRDRLIGIREVAHLLDRAVGGLRKRLQRGPFVPAPCQRPSGGRSGWKWKERDVLRYIEELTPARYADIQKRIGRSGSASTH